MGPFRSKLVSAVWRIMADADNGVPGPASEDAVATLEAMLGDYSVTRDLLPLLRRPPQVCPECGKTFRGLVGGEWGCFECRTAAVEAELRAKERARIEAEVRAQIAKEAQA